MGKRIIQQRRGRGTKTYRVKRKAFRYRLQYPKEVNGKIKVTKLVNSGGHSAPLAKINYDNGLFYIPAFKKMFEGQEINLDDKEIKEGQIKKLKDIPLKVPIYCIEAKPKDGGKFVKSSGMNAFINRKVGDGVFVIMPSKKEKRFNEECRAIIGVIAGEGRVDKPVIKAGKKHYIKKTKNKLWPRTSAVKMNVVDHPFGSGRAKNPKSKIAKRNAPAGRRVGLIRPRRTGKKK